MLFTAKQFHLSLRGRHLSGLICTKLFDDFNTQTSFMRAICCLPSTKSHSVHVRDCELVPRFDLESRMESRGLRKDQVSVLLIVFYESAFGNINCTYQAIVHVAWENSRHVATPPGPRSGKGSASGCLCRERNFASANQTHYPDLGSDTSSVWNFCSRLPGDISRGNQWWCRDVSAVSLGYSSQGCHLEAGAGYFQRKIKEK